MNKTSPIIYATSDWHFQHRNLISGKIGIRPKNYETLLIENYTKQIKPEDTVYFLGDMLFQPTSRKPWFAHIMRSLPGNKILIRGNHDNTKHLSNMFWTEECGFSSVHKNSIIINKVLLSHIPKCSQETRVEEIAKYINFKFMFEPCTLNIHGHTHEFKTDDPECLSVCPELNNYELVDITEFLFPCKK